MPGEIPAWFADAVDSGLQWLLTFSFEGAPAAEIIELTAEAWEKTLWSEPVGWVETLDLGRLQTAFVIVARKAKRWPAPQQVLDAMPARPYQKALAPPSLTDEQREYGKQKLREIKELLKKGGDSGS